jgi:hypothetical protein
VHNKCRSHALSLKAWRQTPANLGAQILNQRRNPKKKENDDEEPNEAHSPHHSIRHIGYLHHDKTPPMIRTGGNASKNMANALLFS